MAPVSKSCGDGGCCVRITVFVVCLGGIGGIWLELLLEEEALDPPAGLIEGGSNFLSLPGMIRLLPSVK
jgi:hypothetical protein